MNTHSATDTRGDGPIIVWFRRDLRLHDHPALTDAMRTGRPILPVFVVDPTILRGRFASPNRAWFLRGCLEVLDGELRARGGSLLVRVGPPTEVLPSLARDVAASGVVVSRDYTPFGRSRDRAVAERLARDGVAFQAKRGLLVHEPEEVATSEGRPYCRFTPFLRSWEGLELRQVCAAPDDIAAVPTADLGSVPIADALSSAPTADPSSILEPGEPAARARLARWLDAPAGHGPAGYARTRDQLADPNATSRLGADLRFGTLSPVEVVAAVLERAGSTDGGRRFVSELAWRDFYAHILWHEPRVAREPFERRYLDLPWVDDADALDAWRTGHTGYPIVDAAMRQLAQTGFMPNRSRMIVASFLTKDLGLDWRLGEAHFMHHLVDGDPASNLGGWQWASSIGSDAQPYIRVFNPITQAERFDPDGDYVRRWLPELERVPDASIHEPWMMTPVEQAAAGCHIDIDYPAPIVDHAAARRRALDQFAALG